MTKALLFDFDGVIVDSESAIGHALIEVLAEDGVRVSFADFGHLFGMTGPDNDEQWERFIAEVAGPSAVLEDIEGRMAPAIQRAYDELPLLPGVSELIGAARAAGWVLGLGTGNAGSLEQYLERLGLSSAFDAIVRTHGSEMPSKPAPDVFLALAEELGVAPQHCVVVEDSLAGCEAAVAAGMSLIVCPTIATVGCTFPSGAFCVGSLADVTIPDLAALMSRAVAT